MTNSKLAVAGFATTVLTLFVGSIAFAAQSSGEGYRCLLTHAPFQTHRIITVCDARTPEAMARLHVAKCDPAMMGDTAMRAQCAAMMSDHQGNGSTPTAAD